MLLLLHLLYKTETVFWFPSPTLWQLMQRQSNRPALENLSSSLPILKETHSLYFSMFDSVSLQNKSRSWAASEGASFPRPIDFKCFSKIYVTRYAHQLSHSLHNTAEAVISFSRENIQLQPKKEQMFCQTFVIHLQFHLIFIRHSHFKVVHQQSKVLIRKL